MSEQIPALKAQGLGSTLMNVFSSPTEAFSDLGTAESKAGNWLFPLLILIVLASVSSYVIFSNENLKTQALETQSRAIEKRVAEGKMTQEQADQARSRMENMGGMFIVFGIVGSAVFLTVMMFGAGLFLWLANKTMFKSAVGYGKHLELYGISSWIGVLGGVVTLLMIIGLNTMYASPSAALAVYASFDPTNTTHKLLGAINVFSIWQAIVVGIGISKLGNKPSTVGIGVALGLWAIWAVVQIFLLSFAQ